MKKLALLGLLCVGLTAFVSPEAEAQNSGSYGQKYFTSSQNKKTPKITSPATPATSSPIYADTVVSTGTAVSEYEFINALPFQSTSVTVYLTKGTGTRAGKVTLEASDDGINYQRVRALYGTASPCDSVVVADASGTQIGLMAVKNFAHRFLRVNYTTGANTQTTYLKALATYKLD